MRKKFLAAPGLIFLLIVSVFGGAWAQELKVLTLDPPNKKRGLSVMEALSVRASATEWSEKELSWQDLSDLLWAANGIDVTQQIVELYDKRFGSAEAPAAKPAAGAGAPAAPAAAPKKPAGVK